jgi:cell shape-determining protein MreC
MSYPSYSDLELEIQELEKENKRLRKELNNLEDVKTVLGDIVMNLTKLEKLKKIVFKDDTDSED